jgi:hypothetical protein
MANKLLTINQITAEALAVLGREMDVYWNSKELFDIYNIEKYWKRKWGYKYRIRLDNSDGVKVVANDMTRAEAVAMVKLLEATK